MRIVAVSGDGAGAGKTVAAQKFSQEVWSIAGAMRNELRSMYPKYDWFNKSQEYKQTTIIREHEDGRKCMRQVLLEYGQVKCAGNPVYWVEQLADTLKTHLYVIDGVVSIGIDDVRKVCELEFLRTRFPGKVFHLHVANSDAVIEPLFDAPALKARADYVIAWKS